MSINRRGFFKCLFFMPALNFEKTKAKETELAHYKAKDGYRATVFLNGIKQECVTELIGHSLPGKTVDGKIRVHVKRKGKLLHAGGVIVQEWKTGRVRWELNNH